jgi:cytochrome b6-f complex iron-sulfur subunit
VSRPDNIHQLKVDGVSRRTVLAVGAAGTSTLVLAACSKAASPGAQSSTTAASSAAGPSSAASSTSAASSSSAAGTSSAVSTAAVLAPLSSVAVGAAISTKGSDGKDIIISRTGDSTVVAFSAICPHQGCTVASSFVCPCHGSTFDAKTGAHLSGPAPTGLATVRVAISGQNIVAG